jgi:hypothetical protein
MLRRGRSLKLTVRHVLNSGRRNAQIGITVILFLLDANTGVARR